MITLHTYLSPSTNNNIFIVFACLLSISVGLLTFFSNISIFDNVYALYSLPSSSSSAVIDGNNTTTNKDHTLVVSGSSTSRAIPDKVILTLGVQTVDKSARAAALSNSVAMNKIVSALLASGLRQNETSTSSFSISPNYNYSKGANNITGFTVANSILIQSTNTANVAKWIDTSIANGANSVNSVYFTISDKKLAEVKDRLIPKAIDDAKNKANIAAAAVGLKVTGVKSISINEFSYPPLPLQQQQLRTAPASANANATPILPGQQQVSLSIGIVFLIG
jgi:uncharacterized protein